MLPQQRLPPPEPEVLTDSEEGRSYLSRFQAGSHRFSAEAGIVSAPGTTISFPTCMHLFSRRFIRDTLLSPGVMANPKYAWASLRLLLARPKRIPGGILLALPWHHNYFHWMLEILPRAGLCSEVHSLANQPFLIPSSCAGFVRESLEISGLAGRALFLDDGCYRASQMHIPTRLAYSSWVTPFAIRWLDANLGSHTSSPPSRRLYISRQDSRYHRVVNEQELVPLLEKEGFEIVTPSRLSLREAIRLFRQAKVVVGSHGAGLANMAFMASGGICIEFFQNGHFNPCYANIAAIKRIDHKFLVARAAGVDLHVSHQELRRCLASLP